MKRMLQCAALLVALLAVGPVLADTFPVRVQDGRGKAVTIVKQPARVASVSAFGADLMGALGRDVVGVSSMGNQKPAFLGRHVAKAVDLGTANETNMEMLAQLAPDLTIGIRTYTEMFEKQFEEIGGFLAYDLVTYEQSRYAIASAATAAGFAEQGRRLNADFAQRLSEVGRRAPGGASAIFIWHWADTLWAHYDHHMTATLMRALKVRNALGPSPHPRQMNPHGKAISMEQLLRLNPDFIFSFQAGDAPIRAHPVWPRLRAVQRRQAYRVGNQYAEVHGPLARDMVLREMAHLLYPGVFPPVQDIPDAARARPLSFRD